METDASPWNSRWDCRLGQLGTVGSADRTAGDHQASVNDHIMVLEGHSRQARDVILSVDQ